MPTYKAPLSDIRFVLEDVLDVGQLASLPGYEEATAEMLLAVLEEGGRICEDVLFPLNQVGDQEGCRLENGVVVTPPGFREAYQAFCAGGWPGMTADPAYGGQGLPHVARYVFDEMLCSANLSFSMYPELTHGATSLMEQWAADELKQRFLPKLVDGSWTGTMCLTEPHAGTDLGIIRTRAVPAGDGAYQVTGTKIFISAGDHDLAENVIHLVLARLPDAPTGTRGISLFLVPKLLPTEEGRPGTPNGVRVGSLEHKMGIKGNATCVLDFENATGWLVGEPNKGLRAMFTMMNGARLGVGMQGLGLGEVSRQNAAAYARERLQGRALTGPVQPSEEADPIIVHPDVRRMLHTMNAYVEGMRALSYFTALQLDIEHHHPDSDQRAAASDLLALLTPIVKAFLTDVGFEVTNLALQCFGGHGYIREFGMEQYVRDARIAQIYEGTNGVQAMDLIARKIPEDDGRLARRFLELVATELRSCGGSGDELLTDFASRLGAAVTTLQETTQYVMSRAPSDPNELGAAAVDYLHQFGLVATGWMWLRMARAAREKLVGGGGDGAQLQEKVRTARFYFTRLLPHAQSHAEAIRAGAGVVMDGAL